MELYVDQMSKPPLNAIEVLGESWTLTEGWLWIRFRSPETVAGYAGPLRKQEPFVAGECSFEEAVSKLAVALRAGTLVARGRRMTGGSEEIPREHWPTAYWGARHENWISAGHEHWSDIELSGVAVLRLWPDPESSKPAERKRGPKPGTRFPWPELEKAMSDGFREGRFSTSDSDSAIERELRKRQPFSKWSDLTVQVKNLRGKFQGNSTE